MDVFISYCCGFIDHMCGNINCTKHLINVLFKVWNVTIHITCYIYRKMSSFSIHGFSE